MFQKATPESVGISSSAVLDFLKLLEDCRYHTHSILMARGDQVFAEAYFAPFHKDFLHRMYSVSKSFVAVAVGLAVTEGVLSMEDVIAEDFPELENEHFDDLCKACTVADMLTMRSNIATSVDWWGNFPSRAEAYYSMTSRKKPGSFYFYDSIGSFLLGCMIEKRTGKPFLEYLKEKVLLEIGFSKESYVLREPGGFTVGDSGVLCTTRDLALFARFIMQKGNWKGKQYIRRDFMEQAVLAQVSNDLNGTFDSYNTRGYGYLIWRTHPDGFSLVGMGDQLAICDEKRDLLFVITSDNQADESARHVLYHEYYRHFLPTVQDAPLPENPEAHRLLEQYLTSAKLICRHGAGESPILPKINRVRYLTRENRLKLSWFCLDIRGNQGKLQFERKGRILTLPFAMGENLLAPFSFGERAVADAMGKNEPGTYACAISAAWTAENTISIMAQVIDTYFGCLNVHICFQGEEATLLMRKSGQYVFDGIGGFAVGKKEETHETT